MCKISTPKPEPIKIDQPQYLRNPYLDDARNSGASAASQRTGRSALRIPLDTGLGVGFSGRDGSQGTSTTAGPRGNGRTPGASGPSTLSPITGRGVAPTPTGRPGGGGRNPGSSLRIN